MAILKIARMGHPVLRQRACEVADPFADEIAVLVEDMIETMYDANGRGLAAPQVHVPLRVVVFYPGDGDELVTLVNPTVELLTDERVESWEGCLSVPGLRGWSPGRLRCGIPASRPGVSMSIARWTGSMPSWFSTNLITSTGFSIHRECVTSIT